jgi:carbon storage regulator
VLVLLRRQGECIVIGDDIVITVVGFERGRVRIGIQAPRHIAVDREEIYERKKAEKLKAVS